MTLNLLYDVFKIICEIIAFVRLCAIQADQLTEEQIAGMLEEP